MLHVIKTNQLFTSCQHLISVDRYLNWSCCKYYWLWTANMHHFVQIEPRLSPNRQLTLRYHNCRTQLQVCDIEYLNHIDRIAEQWNEQRRSDPLDGKAFYKRPVLSWGEKRAIIVSGYRISLLQRDSVVSVLNLIMGYVIQSSYNTYHLYSMS